MNQNVIDYYRQLRRVGRSVRDAHNIAKRMDSVGLVWQMFADACQRGRVQQRAIDHVLKTAQVDYSRRFQNNAMIQ